MNLREELKSKFKNCTGFTIEELAVEFESLIRQREEALLREIKGQAFKRTASDGLMLYTDEVIHLSSLETIAQTRGINLNEQ